MTNEREHKIRVALGTSLAPSEVVIKDQSHLHAGHAGSQDGKGHFDLVIVSEKFAGASRVRRHRMVYDALSRLMQTDIHAIRIKALTAEEYRPGDQSSQNI